MSEIIRVNKGVKEKLVKIAAELQLDRGKRVSLNEAVEYLITFYYEENKKSQKNVQLLFSLLGSAKGIREELERSGREDEGSS
ncbi:MAG: VapB-type antitoxin [Sulfolobus sp.]